MLLYWVWHYVINNPPNPFCGQECRSRSGNCYQQQSHKPQLSNLMCYKWPTMMQQTTQVSDRKQVSFSLAAGHSMQTTPSACLTVEENSRKYCLSLSDFAMQCKLLHLLCCRQLYILCLPKSPKHKQLFTRFSHSEGPLSCVNVALRYCFNHCITIFDSGKSPCRRPGNISQWTKDNKTTYTAELYSTLYIV